MNKVKQELEKILFDQLNCNYKFISSTNTSKLFQIISHGIEYSETSNFNEAVNITSIGEAKSRSVKYIIRFKIEDLFEYIAGTIITEKLRFKASHEQGEKKKKISFEPILFLKRRGNY